MRPDAQSSTSGEIVGPTPGTAFVGSGNIATDTANLLGKGAVDTIARMPDKALGKLDGLFFEIQGVQHVPLWDNQVGNLTVLFPGKAPRLRGAVTPRQQDSPWLETIHRLGYNIESLLRGGQHLGLTTQRLSPQAIADEIWKTHFAFNRLSDFEKHVMRRVVPFYSFTSRNIPLQLVPLLSKRVSLSCMSTYHVRLYTMVGGVVWIRDATAGNLWSRWIGTTEKLIRIGHSLLAFLSVWFGGQLFRRLYHPSEATDASQPVNDEGPIRDRPLPTSPNNHENCLLTSASWELWLRGG